MSHEKKSQIKEFLVKNGLQVSVQVFGLLFLILNLWLSSQLAPLAQGIASLNQRVMAIEEINKNHITHAEFTQLIRQVDSISVRLDQLIARK